MRREWELEELIECWTLDEGEPALLGNRSGATRPGFGLMLITETTMERLSAGSVGKLEELDRRR